MARGVGLDRRGKNIEGIHRLVVAVEIILHHFHRLELLETRFLCYLILAVVGVMLEMAYIGDVADIAHLVAEMLQIALHDVECYRRTCVTEMTVAIDRRSADIHADKSLMERPERFLVSGESVIYRQIVGFHD